MFGRTYLLRTSRLLPVLAVVVVLAGCGSPTKQAARPSTGAQISTSTGATETLVGPAARCGPPNRPDARLGLLPGTGTARMAVAQVGRGSTTAVFLHQTDGDGICGFWPYATWLTDHYPVRAVLVDLCGYGRAECPNQAFSDNQILQVTLAVRFARATGATRVVLVGASMGGALALASATPTRADALVDLSGPPNWRDAEAAPAAARLRVPALLASSPGDSDTDYADLRAAFGSIRATPKKFVPGDGPHGWDLLADYNSTPRQWRPLATTVAYWVTGQYDRAAR